MYHRPRQRRGNKKDLAKIRRQKRPNISLEDASQNFSVATKHISILDAHGRVVRTCVAYTLTPVAGTIVPSTNYAGTMKSNELKSFD